MGRFSKILVRFWTMEKKRSQRRMEIVMNGRSTSICHSWQCFQLVSWSPEKWRLVHNRSRSVQDQYKRSVLSVSLLVIIWNILYSMTFKQSISCHLVFIIWFCPDRDHRKGVIKLGLRARARGERRSREKRGMTGIFFALYWCSCVSISFFFSIIP